MTGAPTVTAEAAAPSHAEHHHAASLPLRAGVVVGVLLASDLQVVSDVGQHGVALGLRALDRGVVATDEANDQCGFFGRGAPNMNRIIIVIPTPKPLFRLLLIV